MEEAVIQIKSGITINVDASVKNIKHVKKIIFGVLLYVIVKMENIEQVVLMIEWFRMMKLQKKQKQLQQF